MTARPSVKAYAPMANRFNILLKDDGSHTGMMKALCLAYRQNVSICQVLMEYQAQSS